MAEKLQQCPVHLWCEQGNRPHLAHRQHVRTVLLAGERRVDVSVVAAGGDRMVEVQDLVAVWLTMSEARELGAVLVDVVHRFG